MLVFPSLWACMFKSQRKLTEQTNSGICQNDFEGHHKLSEGSEQADCAGQAALAVA